MSACDGDFDCPTGGMLPFDIGEITTVEFLSSKGVEGARRVYWQNGGLAFQEGSCFCKGGDRVDRN
ncbi:MAG: hypothetical protein BWY82_01628 [Verrucomicrobia bacterium ADurb.Bin474]|nr:MAG: hypothetical protein BWY82_01628 [Verrucomicrobia bacterium ADurb.Bin474]